MTRTTTREAIPITRLGLSLEGQVLGVDRAASSVQRVRPRVRRTGCDATAVPERGDHPAAGA
jgi:hypothetical protein